jgi:hypothetical protein
VSIGWVRVENHQFDKNLTIWFEMNFDQLHLWFVRVSGCTARNRIGRFRKKKIKWRVYRESRERRKKINLHFNGCLVDSGYENIEFWDSHPHPWSFFCNCWHGQFFVIIDLRLDPYPTECFNVLSVIYSFRVGPQFCAQP